MNLETRILARGKDKKVSSFHGCQCFRAKGPSDILHQASPHHHSLGHCDSKTDMHEVSRSSHDSPYCAQQVPRINKRSEGGSRGTQKMTREQRTTSLQLACKRESNELFK